MIEPVPTHLVAMFAVAQLGIDCSLMDPHAVVQYFCVKQYALLMHERCIKILLL